VKISLPKGKWCTQGKVKVNVLNLSDKMKVLDFAERWQVFRESGAVIQEKMSQASTVQH
jgi:hypothetical protein